MSKIVHISWLKRDDGSLGGVEKFAWLLREHVAPDMRIIAQRDFPGASVGLTHVLEQVGVVTYHALEQGMVDEDTTVICDGFWGMGLEGKVKRLISVAHGTWLGNFIENERNPWDDPDALLYLADLQGTFWKDERVEIIAVSKQAAREVGLATGREVPVILNGVDTTIFHGVESIDDKLVLHTADRPSKGSDIVGALEQTTDWRLGHLGVISGKLENEAARWREGAIALFPSRYEGCPYAWLEAIACDLPIVAYKVGLGVDLPAQCGEMVDDYHPRAFEEALRRVGENMAYYEPRQWVLDRADIERWAGQWERVLQEGD